MNPRPKPTQSDKSGKELDKAVRKVERKEAKAGKKNDPTPSVGRRVREGWIEGA